MNAHLVVRSRPISVQVVRGSSTTFMGARSVPDVVQWESGRRAVVLAGLRGPSGASAASYEHSQAAPAAIWNINHLLGFRPNISAYNVGSRMVIGEVRHISIDQAEVIFDMPVAGFAICS